MNLTKREQRKINKYRHKKQLEKCKIDIRNELKIDEKTLQESKRYARSMMKICIISLFSIIVIIALSGKLLISDQAVTTLGGIAIACTGFLFGVLWKYYDKSYKETKAERETELEEKKLNIPDGIKEMIPEEMKEVVDKVENIMN